MTEGEEALFDAYVDLYCLETDLDHPRPCAAEEAGYSIPSVAG